MQYQSIRKQEKKIGDQNESLRLFPAHNVKPADQQGSLPGSRLKCIFKYEKNIVQFLSPKKKTYIVKYILGYFRSLERKTYHRL